MCACVLSCFSHVWLFVMLWTVALQAPLSMGFSRQEDWSGLPFPFPRDLPNPGIEPVSRMSPSLAGGVFTTRASWEAQCHTVYSPWVSSLLPKLCLCIFSMFLCVVVDYIFYCCIVFHDINIPLFLYLAYHWWISKLFSLIAITNYITIIFFVHVLLCMFAWSIISIPRYIPHKNS